MRQCGPTVGVQAAGVAGLGVAGSGQLLSVHPHPYTHRLRHWAVGPLIKNATSLQCFCTSNMWRCSIRVSQPAAFRGLAV